MAGIDLLHIPYKGGGQAISDLVGGQVPVAILGMAAVLPHVKSGRARILAVTTKTRSKAVPDAPTLDESVAPGYDVRQWAGLMAPAKTPPEILSRFTEEAGKALATPVTRERFDNLGFDVSGMSGGEFQGYLRSRSCTVVEDHCRPQASARLTPRVLDLESPPWTNRTSS